VHIAEFEQFLDKGLTDLVGLGLAVHLTQCE
jgi:hypothetical protein